MNQKFRDLLATLHVDLQQNETMDVYGPNFYNSLASNDHLKFKAAIKQINVDLHINIGKQPDLMVNFFQTLYNDSLFNKEFILSYWIFYIYVWTKPLDENEEAKLLKKINELIEEHRPLQELFASIFKIWKLDPQQQEWLMSTVKESAIYDSVRQLLTVDDSPSEEKIKERHEDLLYIMKQIEKYHNIAEVEIHRHILVQFEKKYNVLTPQGEKVKTQLMELKQIQEKLINKTKPKIKSAFSQLQRPNCEDRLLQLQIIKSELVNFDNFLFKRLIELSSQKFKEKQVNKNLVLLVGPSGSGKTTIMLRLLGYDLELTKYRGLKTLAPKDLKPEHKPLHTSPQTNSITRYLFSEKISKTFMAVGNDQIYYICDTPGFQDSAGPEVDASNMISIIKAVAACRSIKIVVVVSQRKVGDRFEGIKKIAKIVSNMITDFKRLEKDKAIEFIFNKFDNDQDLKGLPAGITDILNNLGPLQSSNQSYKEFLTHLYKKISKKNSTYLKFQPNIDIKQTIESLDLENMSSCTNNFKNSWSEETKSAIKVRQTTLQKNIKDYIGKDNNKAFYYLNELQVMSMCLDHDDEIRNSLLDIKNSIKTKAQTKYDTFCKILAEEIQKNDANNSSYSTIQKYSKQIGEFEIFFPLIDSLITSAQITSKIDDVKKKQKEIIKNLSCPQGQEQQVTKKVVSIFRFIEKISPNEVEDLFQMISSSVDQKKKILKESIKGQNLKNIKDSFDTVNTLFNILAILSNQPCLKDIINILKFDIETQRTKIEQQVNVCLNKTSTKILSILSKTKIGQQITAQDITSIKNIINQLSQLQFNSDKINPKTVTNSIKGEIYISISELIQKTLTLFSSQDLSQGKINQMKVYRQNINKIHSIYEKENPTPQVERLIKKLKQYINSSKQKLLDFIEKLRQDKAITKKNLKSFNKSYQVILKLAEDEQLEKQICQLKQTIRKNIQKHIRQLEQKNSKTKISLKSKKSITHENIIQVEKIIYEAEAFSKTKQFKKPQFLSSKSDVLRSKLHIEGQESSDSDKQQLNVGQISHKIFKELIDKILIPYKQISQQVKRMSKGGLGCLNSKFINELQQFQNYRFFLQSRDIVFCRQFEEQKKNIQKNHNYREDLTGLLQIIKQKINLLSEQSKQAKFIDSDKFNEISQLKRVIVFLIDSSRHEQVTQLFIQCYFNLHQILDIFQNLIKNTFTVFGYELSESKKKDKVTNIKRLKQLKEKMENIKFFDNLYKDNSYSQTTLSFETLITETSKYIQKIQDMKASEVNSLFKDSEIIIKDIKQAHQLYSTDGERNQENIKQLYDNLKDYGKKTMSNVIKQRKNYLKEDTMTFEGSFAIQYIASIEKAFILYKEIIGFVDKEHFLSNFALNQEFFKNQLKEINVEQKLNATAEAIQQRIKNFDYKGKQKEFDKIIQTMRKIQNLSKVLGLSEQHYPFSDRLKETKSNIDNQFSLKLTDNINIEQLIAKDKLVNLYIRLDKNSLEKKKIDDKIDQTMNNLFLQYHKHVNKSEPQIAAFEDRIKKVFSSLPQNMRTIYRQQFKAQKQGVQQKTRVELKNLNKAFEGVSLQNLRKLSSKIKESNKEAVQKQGISVFQKNIKQIEKQIMVFDNNKRLNLVKSLKKYLFYFGPQNSITINEIISVEKTKQIFRSLQKTILTQFSQQLKDLIKQLIQLMNKLYQQNSKQFDDKCQRVNEFYVLILQNVTIEPEYNSKFNICIIQYEKCLSAINQKLKILMQQSKDFSLKKHDYSGRKLQKNLSDLKMIRIFQDSLAQSTLNSKKQQNPQSQKQALLLKSFLKNNTQQTFFKVLNREVLDLINNIQKITFFDDLIKVYNTSTLQLQFQNNVIKNLKIIKQIEQLNKKYSFNQSLLKRNSQNLIKQTQQKWDKQLKQCLEEFEEGLFEEKMEISQKISTFQKLAIIFDKKQWTLIDKNLKSILKIQQLYKKIFDKIDTNLQNHFKFIENELSNKTGSNKSYTYKKTKMLKQIQRWKQDLETLRSQLNFKIINAATEETKQKLVLQLSNAELLHKEKVDKQKFELNRQYELSLKKNEASLEDHITKKVVPDLISMKKYSQSVASKAKQCNTIIENFITKLCKYDKKINKYLYSALSNSTNPYALMIASEGLFFRAQVAEKFKNKTNKQDLGYIINNCPSLKDDKNLRASIERAYMFYQAEYEKNINAYKDSPRKEYIDTIANSLMEHKSRSTSSKLQPAQVVAKIFSIWSIINADLSDPDNPQIDFQPHPAQIVSILLLIGFNDRISSKLIELKTGEGKSIVLAGLCCYLALSGFKAYCACYSEYLSTRDQKLFKDLFDYLGVRESISYGTFGEHCQAIINEIGSNNYEKSTFRDNIKQLIMQTQPKNQQKLKEQFHKMLKSKDVSSMNKVLIIDQADVFFNKNFFGQLYIPSITFQGAEVKEVIQKIWRMTQPSRQNTSLDRITKQQVVSTQQFSKFLLKYGPIQSLMENQVIGMIEAAYNYQHSYTIHQESIKYVQNDNITDKISYGYRTVFANCFQYDRKNICESAYNASLNISIKIGEFSYSQLPNFFRNILGVSGTLSSMSDFKLPLLKDKYGITDLYAIPSIYGQSKRTDDVYNLVSDDDLYDRIVETVKRVNQSNRPTIIFFRSIPQIIAFYKSPQFKALMDKATILSEETDHQSRDIIIKRVGYNNTITISTNSFSRGTDFQVLDEKIKEAGGLLVIQTSIPADCSEFIQVRGRTARQGEKGSFIMIICESQMEKFQIKCNDNSKFYDKMIEAWKKIQCNECQHLRKKVEQRKIRHDDTISLLSTRFSRENIIDYIYQHNMYIASKPNKVRTLIGIDGTSSMGAALQMVKNIVSESFIRTKQVLDEKQIKGSFENKIAIYRNYNSDHKKLLEYSPFETQSERLGDFLKTISIEGGFGNEAVEVLFQHANNIDKLDQIILIADARANTINQVSMKRGRHYAPNYWIENGFPQTDSQKELLKLIQKKIKIHTLYIYLDSSPISKRKQLKDYCEYVSNQTSGISSELKIKEPDAASFLTGFFVKNILLQIGGEEKGRELVQNYDLKYGAVPMRI